MNFLAKNLKRFYLCTFACKERKFVLKSTCRGTINMLRSHIHRLILFLFLVFLCHTSIFLLLCQLDFSTSRNNYLITKNSSRTFFTVYYYSSYSSSRRISIFIIYIFSLSSISRRTEITILEQSSVPTVYHSR